MKNFLISMAVQMVSYTNLTINFRAIAHANYAMAGLTAGIAAIMAYTIVRRVARDDDSWSTIAGLTVGGILADMLGIWLTRHW